MALLLLVGGQGFTEYYISRSDVIFHQAES